MKSMRFSTFRRFLVASVAVLLVVGTATSAAAQSPTLAELARKEQERRKAQAGAPKVLTNKDLPPSAQRPAPAAPAPATAAAEQKPAEPKPVESKPADDCNEACWRARMADAREYLRQNEVFAEALQSRVNALRADFLRRDNPVQRARVAEDREKALMELNRVKGEIEKAKKQIADLEEEARKAGVPPGWLR
jgi:hypothetical protein